MEICSFNTAFEVALKTGKAIRRECWTEDTFITITWTRVKFWWMEEPGKPKLLENTPESDRSFSLGDIKAEDWVILGNIIENE